MAATLGEAYVNIIPKAPGIESELRKLFGSATNTVGESSGKSLGQKLLSGLKTAGIVAGVGKIVKDAFAAGGDLQQSFGGLDTIYGDASAAAKEYAQSAAQAGLSANDYAEQAVSFGAALKQAYGEDAVAAMEAANTAIMDMQDNSAKMGTDIESVQAAYQGFAKQNYTMLDNLKLGYGGTKTEMERLLADAQKLSGVEYNIDNLGDVYDAIHVIQESLGITGVAAEEAKTTLTGSLAAMKASWTNVLAAITTGEGLDTAMSNLRTTVGYFVNNAMQMFGTLLSYVPTFIGGLGNAVLSNAPQLIASGLAMIGELLAGFLNGIPDFLANIPVFWGEVKEAFASVDWHTLGDNIIQGIVAGAKAAGSALLGLMKDLAASALSAAKSALGIASPSKVFANEIGKWIPEGMAVGVEANLSPVNSSINRMATAATDEFSRASAPGATAERYDSGGVAQRTAATTATPKVVIEFSGSLAQLCRVLQPHIRQEEQRVGTQYVTA